MAAACVYGGGVLVSAVDGAEAEMSNDTTKAVRVIIQIDDYETITGELVESERDVRPVAVDLSLIHI